MSFFTKNKLLVTHNATFHADDIFATATLSLLNDGHIHVVRTRDEEFFKKGDYVYDVGGEYDPSRNRFDHHQKGGAGVRDNGIPYAAFGLVWKSYGEKVCGSKEVADRIDERLVQSIDANDNGINLFDVKGNVAPYLLQDMFFAFRPSYTEEQEYDKPFMKMVAIATEILSREILKTKDALDAQKVVTASYENAQDKKLIVLDGLYPWGETLGIYPEPLYVVSPKGGNWRVECVRKERFSFENRKPLPESWGGLRDENLALASGVPDATFCHNGRFLAVAKSKEGAIALANKALLA
jgi:uncharacterized UPF0160 family protein